jgi:phosphopentomutase
VRALVLVLDSVGIGGAPDAASYGDDSANTLGHILEQAPELQLPNLESLGLGELVPADRSHRSYTTYKGSYGKMQERSAGKDTTTGHWEIAGVVLEEPFATYERFPEELVRAIERDAGVQFIGNYAQSARPSWPSSGPNTSAPASRSSTPRRIPFCKSPPTSK